MTESPAPSDTAASTPRLAGSLRPSRRRVTGLRLNRPPVIVPSAHRAATLTDLSSMISSVHTIRSRGGVARDLDQRLTVVIAELESLIHDLLRDKGPATNGAKTPSPKAVSSGAAGAGQTRAEAAFDAWLTSDDKPDAWQLDGPDSPPVSLTGILGELVLSRCQLPVAAAAALGMPPGTALGYAAAELLLAVNDPAGPRCRSYRSALYYLRDHDDAFTSP